MKSLKINYGVLLLFALSIGLVFSCGKDDEEPTQRDAPISSFQFEVSDVNFLEVAFSNFSQNATSYSWNFGDGNSSTEQSPTHTYSEGGDYTVELTATNADGTPHVSSKSFTLTDPNSAIKDITGETSKVWKLSRNIDDGELPILVGPTDRSQIWWALGQNDPIGTRPCIMEEEYIFHLDGKFVYDAKGLVFADYGIWDPAVEGQCVDETDPNLMKGAMGEDLLPWGSGTHSFEYDATESTLTLTGLGAHVGLPKVASTSEVKSPQAQVVYSVISLETSGPVDKMVLETTIDGGYWQFNLVSYDNPADEPELPGAAPVTAFNHTVNDRTVEFENKSVNATSYSWDFGDGNMSSEENPIHTYANDGSYDVKLVATNADGSNEATVNIVISTGPSFSAAALHGGGSKVWKLNPIAGAMAVGDAGKGSSNFWKNTADDVATRNCAFDDTYSFDMNGAFEYKTNGNLWGEGYMGIDPPGCTDEADLPSDATLWGSSTHTFTVTEATANEPAFITLQGTGAFIAIAKAYNGGEYSSAPPTESSVTYEVLNYIDDGTKETLILTIDISDGQTGGAYWTYQLVSE